MNLNEESRWLYPPRSRWCAVMGALTQTEPSEWTGRERALQHRFRRWAPTDLQEAWERLDARGLLPVKADSQRGFSSGRKTPEILSDTPTTIRELIAWATLDSDAILVAEALLREMAAEAGWLPVPRVRWFAMSIDQIRGFAQHQMESLGLPAPTDLFAAGNHRYTQLARSATRVLASRALDRKKLPMEFTLFSRRALRATEFPSTESSRLLELAAALMEAGFFPGTITGERMDLLNPTRFWVGDANSVELVRAEYDSEKR